MRWRLRSDLIGDTSAREIKGVGLIGVAARTAALSKITWAAVAIAVVLSLFSGAAGLLLLLPILPAAFVVTFLATLAIKGLQIAGDGGLPERPIQLPDPELFADGDAQAASRRLIEARRRLTEAVRESPRGSAFDLSAIHRCSPGLEKRIVVLLARAEYIGSFLKECGREEIGAALDRLRNREKAPVATISEATYRRTIAQRENHLETIRSLEADRKDVLATADYLLATLESLPATITHLQHLRLSYGDGEIAPDSITAASQLTEHLSAFESALIADAGRDSAQEGSGN